MNISLLLYKSFDKIYHSLSLSIIGTILLSVCSQIVINITFIPISFITIAVLFIGFVLPKKEAILSVIIWILLGSAGMPVFANFRSGLLTLLGPTGGYIFGFLLTVITISLTKDKLYNISFFKEKILLRTFLLSFIGYFIFYSTGVIHLSKFIGTKLAIEQGFIRFIFPELIKIFIYSFITNFSYKKCKK